MRRMAHNHFLQRNTNVPRHVAAPAAAGLRVIHITDVYTLVNFPSLKTLIQQKTDEFPGKTVTMLTGDFLAPSLLSSIDKGEGMINCLNALPVDYVCWGNH